MAVKDKLVNLEDLKVVGDAVGDLKSQIGEIIEASDNPHSVDLSTSNSFEKLTNTNAAPSTGGIAIASNSSYDSYVWVVDRDADIYFSEPVTNQYVSLNYGYDYTVKVGTLYNCSNPARKRTSDNNLPKSAETALSLEAGDIIIVTITANTTINIYGVEPEYQFTEQMIQQIDDEIEPTKAKVDYTIELPQEPIPTKVSALSAFTKSTDYNAAATNEGISVASLSGYDTYVWIVDKTTEIYFETPASGQYVSVCYGEDYTTKSGMVYLCSNAVRKRTSDNNLPISEETAISLNDGDIVAVTVISGQDIGIYGVEDVYTFTDNAKNEIRAIAGVKKPVVQYNNAQQDNETERLYIYIPSGVGYVKYNFAHFVSAAINSNCWLIHPLTATDDQMNNRFFVTTAGEFECALQILNSPDYMGGSAHGSEIMQSIHFFVDGAETDPSTITSATLFDTLRIVEQSKLFDPSDEETVVAIHGKEYIFDAEKLVINQTILWKHAETLSQSYLAMLPVAKSVTTNIVTNNEYQAKVIANSYGTISNVDTAISWDDEIGFSVRFSKTRWEINGQNIVGTDNFLLTDNNGQAYNKQYFTCLTSGSVSVDDIWKTSTEYVFEINK